LPVVVGISGASGAQLAQRAIERLGEQGQPLILTCTDPGARVWKEELGVSFKQSVAAWERRFAFDVLDVRNIGANIASGAFLTLGMLVVPCSTEALAAIAHGHASNLLERAADVTIKEARRLVLVPRETPLSAIHLENMLALARLGVRIVPPMPAFYLRPTTVTEVVEALVDRILQALGLPG
jgi:4-hydroxy-3-polyprenylbenzoate decarboxylase